LRTEEEKSEEKETTTSLKDKEEAEEEDHEDRETNNKLPNKGQPQLKPPQLDLFIINHEIHIVFCPERFLCFFIKCRIHVNNQSLKNLCKKSCLVPLRLRKALGANNEESVFESEFLKVNNYKYKILGVYILLIENLRCIYSINRN